MSTFKRVTTADGSLTLRLDEPGEHCHSLAGARSEASEKFVKPALTLLENKTANGPAVRLLDACFGLGYNSLALGEALSASSRQLVVCGLEIDREVVRETVLAGEAMPGMMKAAQSIAETQMFESPLLKVKVHNADLSELDQVQVLISGMIFDVVFHDAFSPAKCPELWTVELCRFYYSSLVDDGFVLTYSEDKAWRAGLILAGFAVSATVPFGRKGGGTLAVKSNRVQTESGIRNFFERTTAGIPYRQPPVRLPPEETRVWIKNTREREKSEAVKSGKLTIKQFLRGEK